MIETAARSGRLDAFADRYWQRALRFHQGFSHGLHLSVLCPDDIDAVESGVVDAATSDTFMGRYLFDEYRRACAAWPHARPASVAPVPRTVPALLVSGELDPVTPPAFGARAARWLTNSRHVVVPGGAHGSAATCARSAMLHVLMTATVDDAPDACRSRSPLP
jgi:pimeloyl-ACP methyl ester carboxylesterase